MFRYFSEMFHYFAEMFRWFLKIFRQFSKIPRQILKISRQFSEIFRQILKIFRWFSKIFRRILEISRQFSGIFRQIVKALRRSLQGCRWFLNSFPPKLGSEAKRVQPDRTRAARGASLSRRFRRPSRHLPTQPSCPGCTWARTFPRSGASPPAPPRRSATPPALALPSETW